MRLGIETKGLKKSSRELDAATWGQARGPAARRIPAPGLLWKILFFAVALVVLPLLMLAFSMMTVTRDELKGVVNDRLVARMSQLTDEIRLATEPSLRGLALLGDLADDPALDADSKAALLHSAIESLPGLVGMQLVIGENPPVYILERPLAARLDAARLDRARCFPAPRSVLRRGGGAGSVTALDPIHLAGLDLWLLPLLAPLPHLSEQGAGLLVAYLDLTEVRRSLTAQGFSPPGGIWALDDRQRPLFSGAAPPAMPGWDQGVRGPDSAGSLLVTPWRDPDGVELLGAATRLDFPPWTLIAAAPAGQAYALVARLGRELAVSIVLGLLAAVGGALLLAYRISRPVRAMALVAERVAQGDLQARVLMGRRHDELGLLGNRLDQMIMALAEGRRRLEQLAQHDALTGLPNRRAALDYLQRALAGGCAVGEQVAVLFLDLDRFKNVNDSLGHGVGDRVLVMVADRFRGCLEPGAMVARLGGDEFLMVLRSVRDREQVSEIAAMLMRSLTSPFRVLDIELYLGVTIGITLAPDNGTDLAELIGQADMAMFRAKEEGRGHYRFFDTDLKSRAVRKLALDTRLRRALERGDLEVYYQPQIDAQHGRIVGMEALLRWPDPLGGFVATPGEFIPLAEETGLIVPLGDWVMDVACGQTRRWQDSGLPRISASVNVSALQFRRHDFYDCVRRSLDRWGLDACHMGLELTEGVLLEDTRRAVHLMSALREMGVQLLLDDFGTGYSSLAYLRHFPLDYVKVAQEFVSGVDKNPSDAMIVSAVIALSKSLGLKIIAEGVETPDQLSFLSERDCDLIQGFYCGRPLTADGFAARLATEQELGGRLSPSAGSV